MEAPNLFERFFATHEHYYRDLELQIKAVEQYPAFFTLQVNAAIARKIKAEYDAMELYYRESGIPNAQNMISELLDGYNKSHHKQDYASTFGASNVFEDSFNGILREVIMSGYVAISHKLEMLIELTRSHSEGKAYATLQEPNGYRTVNYIELLSDEFNFSFDKLLDLERIIKPKHGIYNYSYIKDITTLRIFKIRMTANRIKHQGGYPKHAYDPIFDFYPNFINYPDFGKDTKRKRTFRIPFTAEEFLLDLEYAGKYLSQILELCYHLNRYAIMMEIAWTPAQEKNINHRHVLLEHYVPTTRATIKHLVKQIRNVWLDKELDATQRIPKPTKFVFDESNI